MKTCPDCGTYVRAADHRCPNCGVSTCTGPCGPNRAAAAVLLGLVAGCNGFVGQPKYGVSDTAGYEDADGDGWPTADGDCDDENADIHPEAEEIAGDGVDSNCDGEDDT